MVASLHACIDVILINRQRKRSGAEPCLAVWSRSTFALVPLDSKSRQAGGGTQARSLCPYISPTSSQTIYNAAPVSK